MAATERRVSVPPPPIVALAAGWVPGLGHWLVGQRTRGAMIGVTVATLYLGGLLIGGVRVIDVPTYDVNGQKIANASVLNEIRAKPWAIAQVMAGPLGVASGAASVWAAAPDSITRQPRGVKSHARVNEIGVLYTAVAGMLNLLAILDAVGRAGREDK